MKLVDTTLLIDLLRGRKDAEKIVNTLDNYSKLYTTEINVFELFVGIYSQTSTQQLEEKAKAVLGSLIVLKTSEESITKSAKISADLIKKGERIGNLDCLIAGIALANGCDTIVTRNKEHFNRIKGLKAETY